MQHELYEQFISPEKRVILENEPRAARGNEIAEGEEANHEVSATTEQKQTMAEDETCSQTFSHPTTIYKLDEGIFDFVSTCKSTSLENSSSRTSENLVTVVNMLVGQVNEHEHQIHRINGCIEKMLLVLQNKN